jgi:hypothetical protein
MYYVGCLMLRTGFPIMSCLTFEAKLLLYRHYLFVLDLTHIIGINLYLDLTNYMELSTTREATRR